jgi:3',5'-cyclic AMP phosphodiesterase CpdA
LPVAGLALLAAACAWTGIDAASNAPSTSNEPSIRNAPQGTPTPPPFDPMTDRTERIQGFVPSTFAVIGDFGSADSGEQAVADRMCSYRKRHPFDHVMTTGDNIYPDGDPARIREAFLDPFDCLLGGGVKFHASLGNHDVITKHGLPEIRRDIFGMPGRNYVFRRRGVRFVVADSNRLDFRWLRRATRAKDGDHWTIVLFHHPVYSGGTGHGSTPNFAQTLTPLFEKRGVDLVLNGHDHVYSVTREVRGIRYVVTGGGGARPYGCRVQAPVRKCITRLHFLYVTATATHLKVEAVPAKGTAIHSFKTRGRA